ncbi:MAG: 3-oxoacid CoA-transferase [Deltaproteobacteria bacterium]|nr:3-oxoacid CoA-transferase [Deltaproteobacteria bacterium]
MTHPWNEMELMVVVASRLLEDGRLVVVGTGGPCAATMLAQKTHAPRLIAMFEAGGVGPVLEALPISVGDSRTWHRGLSTGSMAETMSALARGQVDYCFLGGAQIDPYGNLNSTLIGSDYHRPKVRFPGSGGANDLASHAWRTLVITPQDARRFVEHLVFSTSPGYLHGKGAREAAGLPPGTGPYKVVTQLAVYGFDEDTCRMRVESLHPGVTLDDVRAATGFELLVAPDLGQTPAPSDEELRILREEVDPDRLFIGR